MHTAKNVQLLSYYKAVFLKTKRKCRCFYCRSNRQYANMKRLLSAEEKLREWSVGDV